MSQLKPLSSTERKNFDNPPVFSRDERNLFFHLKAKTRRIVSSLKRVENRVGFVLQHGYFKAAGRFYASEKFKQRDHQCSPLNQQCFKKVIVDAASQLD